MNVESAIEEAMWQLAYTTPDIPGLNLDFSGKYEYLRGLCHAYGLMKFKNRYSSCSIIPKEYDDSMILYVDILGKGNDGLPCRLKTFEINYSFN